MEQPNGERIIDTHGAARAGRAAEGRPSRGVTGLSPQERARPGSLSPPAHEPAPTPSVAPRRKLNPWLWTGLILVGLFLVAGLAFFAVLPLIVAIPIVVVFVAAWLVLRGLASSSNAAPVTEAGKAAEPEPRRVGPR